MADLVFSPKQRRVLTWWRPGSPDRDRQAIICDGAVRSGKTIYPVSTLASFCQEQKIRIGIIMPVVVVLSVIGATELMFEGTTVQGASFEPFYPIMIVALIYFAMTFILSRALGFVEHRMK